ncbi:hypothetical protein [Xenorhabdus sp. KK7.4]|uniref:hypothetical protein n=1 Tax=Xenorhabdus TaxID=626 RepID=UPI000C04BC31|nr:hypothetical protein [Xenorhabdus sp. KK7.4]PHM52507.1 hypothetical protein Xekk_03184 [Xenorhabdus sp. KK7.4]
MEFTDLHIAIEEARYLHSTTRKNHVVLQCDHARLKVIQARKTRTAGRLIMFSTKYDKHHSVLRG